VASHLNLKKTDGNILFLEEISIFEIFLGVRLNRVERNVPVENIFGPSSCLACKMVYCR
jgi:hypothetical protein